MEILLYVIIIGIIINLIANRIWEYIPNTDKHIDKIVSIVLIAICIMLVLYRRNKQSEDAGRQTEQIAANGINIDEVRNKGDVNIDNVQGNKIVVENQDIKRILEIFANENIAETTKSVLEHVSRDKSHIRKPIIETEQQAEHAESLLSALVALCSLQEIYASMLDVAMANNGRLDRSSMILVADQIRRASTLLAEVEAHFQDIESKSPDLMELLASYMPVSIGYDIDRLTYFRESVGERVRGGQSAEQISKAMIPRRAVMARELYTSQASEELELALVEKERYDAAILIYGLGRVESLNAKLKNGILVALLGMLKS